MEKIRLTNGNEFELIPMGITNDPQGKIRVFNVIANLSYDALEEQLIDKENLSVIRYISESGDVLATYTDCVDLISITKERGSFITNDAVVHDVFTIRLSTDELKSIMDATSKKIKDIEEEMEVVKDDTALREELDLISGCILELSMIVMSSSN